MVSDLENVSFSFPPYIALLLNGGYIIYLDLQVSIWRQINQICSYKRNGCRNDESC
jgi:hypothetical protein